MRSGEEDTSEVLRTGLSYTSVAQRPYIPQTQVPAKAEADDRCNTCPVLEG